MQTGKGAARGSRRAMRQEKAYGAFLWGAAGLAVFLVVTMATGMAAFFLKTFLHIQPRWLFGLFE